MTECQQNEDCMCDGCTPITGRVSSPEKVRIVVTDTIEYEVEIDTTDPRWTYLAETSGNPDEWVAMLDDEASQPDSSDEPTETR